MEDFITGSIWPGLIAWVVLYISDNLLTIACARMYRAGVSEKFVFEGSYELNPKFQKDVDALKYLSPRFLVMLAIGAFIISSLWWATKWAGKSHIAYLFFLGSLILVGLTIHIRHIRNATLFRATLGPAGPQGRIEYPRCAYSPSFGRRNRGVRGYVRFDFPRHRKLVYSWRRDRLCGASV